MFYLKLITIISTLLTITACSTSQDQTLPTPDTNVEKVWQKQMNGTEKIQMLSGELKRPLDPKVLAKRQSDYTRDAWRETINQFPRLPNPDIVMYVMPHRVGNLPVPGYSTVFPLYERVHYATPADANATLPKEAW